jgi:hypothetical protein
MNQLFHLCRIGLETSLDLVGKMRREHKFYGDQHGSPVAGGDDDESGLRCRAVAHGQLERRIELVERIDKRKNSED